MKQQLTLLLLVVSSTLFAQKKQLFLGSLHGTYVPEYEMKGGGYSFGYQHQLKGMLYIEVEGGYSIAENTTERGYIENDFYLEDLEYSFSAYSLDIGFALKLPLLKRVQLDVMITPSILYKTVIYDINKYKKVDDDKKMYDTFARSSYFSDAQLGAKAGGRLYYYLNNNWALLLEYKTQFLTKSDYNYSTAGFGLSYVW